MNAKQEIIKHIGEKKAKYVKITTGDIWDEKQLTIEGTPEKVIPQLDFEYDEGFGGQELGGIIWYEDGTWSDRGEYDGSEWWQYQSCPDLPASYNPNKQK